MARFAKIGLNNRVMSVEVVHDDVLKDANGVEQESLGIDFLTKLHGWAIWRQTFTDGTRKNHAGIGHTYDEDRSAFIPKKPYESWILNEDTCQWEAPVAKPDDGKEYTWNESTKNWDEVIR